ncbi:MAG: DUF6438 domain-containing protein [Rufibacter sp.]
MLRTFYLLFTVLVLFSCQESKQETRKLMPQLYGDWVPAGFTSTTDGIQKHIPSILPKFLTLGFSFDSTGIVDTKRAFFIVAREEGEGGRRNISYLGSKTTYFVKDDSLKFFNLTDSTWTALKIARITKDTLSFAYEPGRTWDFIRKYYQLDTIPRFDKIVLSSSGCFGRCEISNISISSDGKVTFYGEQYTTKTGLLSGIITKELYQYLQDNFRKADIKNVDKEFTEAVSDGEFITMSFIKADSIYKTISDYSESGPLELIWAYTHLRYISQKIDLKPSTENILPFYPSLKYSAFKTKNKRLILPQSESFLLWEYIRHGSLSKQEFTKRFEIDFIQNYTWVPPLTDQTFAKNAAEEILEKSKSITTDGRFYKFEIAGKKPVTIDIGFNFFDRNYKLSDFKTQEREEE